MFVDRYGHPSDKPSTTELAEALGVAIKEIEVRPGWTRWTEIGGWHMASGLPKPRDRAVTAGSTYLVRCRTEPAPDRLVVLAARGLGLRRREGLGCVHPMAVPAGSEPTDLDLVAPLREWAKWPRFAPLARTHPARPVPDTHILRKVLADPTLSAAQRAALVALIDLPDADRVRAVLDRLERS